MNYIDWLFRIKGFNLSKSSDSLEKIKELSSEAFIAWQVSMLEEYFQYLKFNNPFYRKLCNKVNANSFSDSPILTKSSLNTKLDYLLSKPYSVGNQIYINNTSGSSGQPLVFAKNKSAHAVAWAIKKDRYQSLGIDIGEKEARFYGMPLDKKALYKERLKDFMMNRFRFPVHDLSDRVFKKIINRFKRTSFVYVYGYTNSVYHFAQFLKNNNIILKDICPSLKLAIVSSEMCTKEKREIIESAFGLSLINEYGSSEFGNIGFQKESDLSWTISESNLFVEIEPIEGLDFEKFGGNILITDFTNKAFPFIRFKIGDLGKVKRDDRGRQVLYDLYGRSDDLIELPSGKKAAGLTFYYISKSLMKDSGLLRQFMVRQKRIDSFDFFYVSNNVFTPVHENLIRREFSKYLENNLIVRFIKVKEIPKAKNGKFRLFESNIN